MFKTLLQQNKPAIAVASVLIGLLVLFTINIVVLVPILINAYKPVHKSENQTAIDIDTVNKAIEYLNE